MCDGAHDLYITRPRLSKSNTLRIQLHQSPSTRRDQKFRRKPLKQAHQHIYRLSKRNPSRKSRKSKRLEWSSNQQVPQLVSRWIRAVDQSKPRQLPSQSRHWNSARIQQLSRVSPQKSPAKKHSLSICQRLTWQKLQAPIR